MNNEVKQAETYAATLMVAKALAGYLAVAGPYQDSLQQELLERTNSSPDNIASSWEPEHFVVNMLDNVIEEAIEAKRLMRLRKWWATPQQIEQSKEDIGHQGKLRVELLEELSDIMVQWTNALVFLNVTPQEMFEVFQLKLAKNSPHLQSTLDSRS